MLVAAFWFFALAIVGILFAVLQVAGISLQLGRFLLFFFLLLALLSYLGGVFLNRSPTKQIH